MIQNRLPNARAMGSTSYDRADEPRPACVGHSDLYDYLIDGRANEGTYRRVVAEARAICGSCPLQQRCLVENRDEDWARAVIGQRPAINREHCGSRRGYKAHNQFREQACSKCKKANARHTAGRAAAA
jgi:hypothetical protein